MGERIIDVPRKIGVEDYFHPAGVFLWGDTGEQQQGHEHESYKTQAWNMHNILPYGKLSAGYDGW